MIVRLRNLFASAMLFSIYSLLCAGLFTVLDAGDVALTEASVGAGISTVLMLAVLAVARRYEKPVSKNNLAAVIVVVVTGAALAWATWVMHPFGMPDNPLHNHISSPYLANTEPDL